MKLRDGKYWVGDPCYAIRGDTDPEIEEDGDWCDDYNDEQWYDTDLESQ